MATYTGIKGQSVQVVSSDPSPLIPGQVWYNSTSCSLKAAVTCPGSGTWTAGGALGTARKQLAGAGTNTAALAFGGSSPRFRCTESYNGTSWTAGGAMGTGRSDLAGAGTNTAALAFGGDTGALTGATESYNGTSWTAGGAYGYGQSTFSRCWRIKHSSISHLVVIQVETLHVQNHIMVHLGQLVVL
jgi:hypothetical protein